MNKKLILSLSTVTLLSTALFANMEHHKDKMQNSQIKKDACMKMMDKTHPKHKRGEMIIGKIMMLDLSAEQKNKIDQLMAQFKEKMQDPYEAFSDNGFDKDKFIDAHKNNFKTMVKHKAQMIEEVYSILTKEQKKDLKTILDMDKIMKKKKFDKMMGKVHKPEFHG